MSVNNYLWIILCYLLLISSQKLLKKRRNIINLSFTINNNYTEKLLIPLISTLENSANNTIYHIFILVGEDFEKKNELLLYNLETIYYNCFIHIINLHKEFENVYKSFLDITVYYRLKLPEICENITRIIYIDCDSIILKDLNELFTLNFGGNYILGKLDIFPDELDRFNIYIKNNINSGVLLMDLYNLRKYKYVEKFMNYTKNNNNKFYLKAHDQTLINYICHDKIGILKPKYHMWPFKDYLAFINEHKRTRIKYDPIDVQEGFNDPFIVHFPGKFKYKDSFRNISFYKNYYDYMKVAEKTREKFNEKYNNTINITNITKNKLTEYNISLNNITENNITQNKLTEYNISLNNITENNITIY